MCFNRATMKALLDVDIWLSTVCDVDQNSVSGQRLMPTPS